MNKIQGNYCLQFLNRLKIKAYARPEERHSKSRQLNKFALGLLFTMLNITAVQAGGNTALTPGSLDTSFDRDGKVMSSFNSEKTNCSDHTADRYVGSNPCRSHITTQLDGKLLVATSLTLARYINDGSLDRTFGVDGVVTPTGFGTSWGPMRTMALQPDGKILVAGGNGILSLSGTIEGTFRVERYNSNGTLDNTFGNNGVVLTNIGTFYTKGDYDNYATLIAVQRDGKIVVGGQAVSSSVNLGSGFSGGEVFYTSPALVRYNSNGSLDTSFGSNGILFSPNSSVRLQAMAIQGDGKIVVAGQKNTSYTQGITLVRNIDIVLARYQPNGTLDTSFGSNGWVNWDNNQYDPASVGHHSLDSAYDIAILPDGRIFVAGESTAAIDPNKENNNYDLALVQFNSNGSLDNAFGSGGVVIADFGTARDGVRGVALQSDGKIVATGHRSFLWYDSRRNTSHSAIRLAIYRFTPNGTLDTGFGSNGQVITSFVENDRGADIIVQSDGKIIAAGSSLVPGAVFSESTIKSAIARYIP